MSICALQNSALNFLLPDIFREKKTPIDICSRGLNTTPPNSIRLCLVVLNAHKIQYTVSSIFAIIMIQEAKPTQNLSSMIGMKRNRSILRNVQGEVLPMENFKRCRKPRRSVCFGTITQIRYEKNHPACSVLVTINKITRTEACIAA
jgi:hypothetical protein